MPLASLLIPRAHIRIDSDAVVCGVSEFFLGDFDSGIMREIESVGAGGRLWQRVFNLSAIGANEKRSRKTTTTSHETQETRTILVGESERKVKGKSSHKTQETRTILVGKSERVVRVKSQNAGNENDPHW